MATIALKPKASLRGHQSLISGDDQAITNAFANLGGAISTKGASKLTLWIELDIGTSVDVRVKALAKLTEDATDLYSFPIESVSASKVAVEAEYYEFNVDADQFMVLEFDLNGSIPFVQLQISSSNSGDGVVKADSCFVSFS